ncbi:MAG: hypothetical protein OHK0032_10080 [Thermodesulfovibrionales bacterium]
MRSSRLRLILLLFLILIPAAVYLLWPSDEGRIKRLFKEGAEAVESKDVDAVMSKVSYNYRDDYGMTYLYIKEILKRQFEMFSDIKVEYEDLKIEVSKDRALAELNVRVIATIGNETGYIIGDIKTPLHLRFTLDKERTRWLIVKTEGFDRLLQ